MFSRCKGGCGACTKAGGRSPDTKEFFDVIERHGCYYTPVKDSLHEGSYLPFLAVQRAKSVGLVPNMEMDALLPERKYPHRCLVADGRNKPPAVNHWMCAYDLLTRAQRSV